MGHETSQIPRLLVIGIGNAYRGDDAAGLAAARRIRDRTPKYCSVLEHTGDGASLIELWTGAERAIVIDAMRSGDEPGTVTRFDATLRPLPAAIFRNSTHMFSLPEAIELSRALQQLPGQLIVYGVEAQDFEAGANLSPAIDFALGTVVQRVLQELSEKHLCSQM